MGLRTGGSGSYWPRMQEETESELPYHPCLTLRCITMRNDSLKFDHLKSIKYRQCHKNSIGHAYIKCLVVSTAAGLGALLHVLSVASLLEGLPGHVLFDVLTLLPSGRGALPSGGAGAVLLVHIFCDGGGDAATDLLRDLVTDFTGSGHIIADLR